MKTAYVSFEVAPFAKVGGLADVAGALPKYIKKLGEDIYVLMPYHNIVDNNLANQPIELIKKGLVPKIHPSKSEFDVYKTFLPDSEVPVYLIKNDNFFGTKDVYGYSDLALQSSYFCDAAISFISEMEPDTEVINANDWQTALIPVYLKVNYREDNQISKMTTVLTIHNLGYQGIFGAENIARLSLPNYLFNVDALEFYGQLNFLKGGLLFADIINTVSKTYAEEIQSPEYGEKLDGVLRIRADHLYGILNGIDYKIYDPKTDPKIYKPINTYEDKVENKLMLQKELGLPQNKNTPVISMITRLVDQKGLDLIFSIFDYLMLFDAQFVILGTGEKKYEDFFVKMKEQYKDKVSINLKFDVNLAQKIYAGSDMFLVPSRYEPCGLGQLYSMRYGTCPIVRYTGGLADTVREYYPTSKTGTGFGFYEYESSKLLVAISKALHYYHQKKEDWINIFNNCISQDFSYESTAKQYRDLYKITVSSKKRW